MEFTSQYQGTRHHISAHWPTYLVGFGGGICLSLLIAGISFAQGWYSFLILGLAAFIVLLFFLFTSIWAAIQLYDRQRISDTIISLSQVGSTETLVHIGLGRRFMAVELSRYLTTGKVIVIDIYNPQIMPDRALARERYQALRPTSDPRLTWREGRISLLPLPDSSVSTVTMNQALSELWQQGDRKELLNEIVRILRPGGSVITSERVRSNTNLFVMGLRAFRLQPAKYWGKLLADAGLQIEEQVSLSDLICCFRATKPGVSDDLQLSLWDVER